MDLGILNRVAMVAASSQGIGKAAAKALAREGCQVSICARSQEALANTLEELEAEALGRPCLAMRCDVSQPEDLARWHEATLDRLGPVDILVTHTGGPAAASFQSLSDKQWESAIQSTLMNVVRLCRLTLPDMQRKGWGRIVHITSFVAKHPMPLLTLSSALRSGLSALTQTMALEFARDGITVNAVLPGHTMTNRQIQLGRIRAEREGIPLEQHLAQVQAAIPMGRFAQPDEIGDAIAFLCSERASYLTGVSLQVEGGLLAGTF